MKERPVENYSNFKKRLREDIEKEKVQMGLSRFVSFSSTLFDPPKASDV